MNDVGNTHPYVRYSWNSAKCEAFRELLLDNYTTQQLHVFQNALENGDINRAVDVLDIIYKRAADDMKRNTRTSTRKTAPANDEWWDKDCDMSKKYKNRLLNIYRLSRTDMDYQNYT